MPYPLAGVRVLDFSRVLAGPYASRMLADLGADVVKIEPPDGDLTRNLGKKVGGFSSYYQQHNAGKRNVCLDLRSPEAVALVMRLVEKADIVLENYRPDVMSRLGIGYEHLRTVNPGIIMLSISGFGHIGPETHRPAYASVVHAEAGLIHRMSVRNDVKHHDLPLSIADTNASLHGLVGILSALLLKAPTGVGQHIDIAMIDSTLATDDQLSWDLEGEQMPRPQYAEIWPTPIGPVLLCIEFQVLFRLLTERLGVVDPANPGTPLEEKTRLRREAAQTFLNTLDSSDAFSKAMRTADVPWGCVRDASTIPSQATIQARGSIVEIDDRAGGRRPIPQSPYRFSNARSGVRGPAAHRGEHNAEVLSEWLDLSDDAIDTLARGGVIQRDSRTDSQPVERTGANPSRQSKQSSTQQTTQNSASH